MSPKWGQIRPSQQHPATNQAGPDQAVTLGPNQTVTATTGSITGNLLGVAQGLDVIPAEWLEELELRDVIKEVADDLCDFPDWEISDYDYGEGSLTDRIWRKYPGC